MVLRKMKRLSAPFNTGILCRLIKIALRLGLM
jgi:hypothetical protein